MSSKGNKNKKKPLETTLGQAPKTEPSVDISNIQKPINTSVFGLKQVLSLFQTATAEVQSYIQYECDVLYECRICRSIFRSLANFILHKRNYCKEKYQHFDDHLSEVKNKTDSEEICKGEANGKSEEVQKKSITPIIERLINNQKIIESMKSMLDEEKETNVQDDEDVVFVPEEKAVTLERIDSSSNAVFQTVKGKTGEQEPELMKSEVMEIHGIFDKNEVVLGQDGKVCNLTRASPLFTAPSVEFRCVECKLRFATQKTLTHHTKYQHNRNSVVYPCPDCGEFFANAWGVYRHLYKIHRRTMAQVRRLRAQIHAGAAPKAAAAAAGRRAAEAAPAARSAQAEWMESLEAASDLQMCGGCGRRFERRAALQSHLQLCTKRSAVCNALGKPSKTGENGAEKVPELPKPALRGAAKRKSQFRRKTVESKPQIKKLDNSTNKIFVSNSFEPVELATIDDKDPLNLSDEILKDLEITKISSIPPQDTIIEVFTISDDSNESIDMQTDSTPPGEKISAEFAELLNDDSDLAFYRRAQSYMNTKALTCSPCNKTFVTPYQLLWHMSLHFNWVRFHCSKCAFQSFNRYVCTNHAYKSHQVPSRMVDSVIIPISKWKIEMHAHEFRVLGREAVNLIEEQVGEEDAPILIGDKGEEDTNGNEEVMETQFEVITVQVTPEKNSMDECAVGGSDSSDFTPPKEVERDRFNSRPVRNRTKSVKTVQNDFIYDLAKVLKLNADNSVRRSRKGNVVPKRD